MIIFPAVDIQGGKAVRLKQGRKEESTVFADDPVKAALHWQEQGAQWLHIVDLDGAFDGKARNASIIKNICDTTNMKIQVGGGIRTLETAALYLNAGADRLIVGTIALENPELLEKMCSAYPNRIGVSLDAKAGKLKSRGWVEETSIDAVSILPKLEEAGAAFIIYTDIARDGMRKGLNLNALEKILQATKLPVIAAGGVASMDDVKAIFALRNYPNLEGMISGRALYEKTLDLRAALNWLEEQ